MAKFREFYVPSGAGSNFLAKQCVWSGSLNEFEPQDINQNEYFINRVKSDSQIMAHDIRNSDPTTATAKYYDCPDKSILSESVRIKPILIEINEWFRSLPNKYEDIYTADEDRNRVINYCDHIWREDNSMWTNSFFQFFAYHIFIGNDMSKKVAPQIREVEDFFAKSREYFYSECERNNWDVFQISHNHPYLSISPRLKFPSNIDTMAMEIDSEMNMYNNALIDIKMYDRINPEEYFIIEDDDGKPKPPEDLFINKSVTISNKKVSFRKIYFENNEDEIRKMYDFFDNEEYFDVNRTSIMKEFKEYHDANIELVQKLAPNLLKQINGKV
jgi:hypothetical protein